MISRVDIQQNFTEINNLYQQSTNSKEALYYSKLALIELCGRIEESIDELMLACANRNLSVSNNRDFVENEIIGLTYGFEYNKHIRGMFMRIIGIINLEKLEKTVDPIKFHLMKSALGTLAISRNKAAHKYINGTTASIDAPSTTDRNFQYVYDGLEDIDNCISRIGL